MSRQAVIEQAMADLCYTESPRGSNHTKYWDVYDPNFQGQPWCVVAMWDWFRRGGESEAFYDGGRIAYCRGLLNWFIKQDAVVPTEDAQPGDVAFFNFKGLKTPDHVGLVVQAWDGMRLTSVEGNTSPGLEGSQDNGGCVALKKRYASEIVAICRPKYKGDENVKDYTGHWAESELDWALRIGLVRGFKDGTTRPDAQLTRAELVTILKRYDEYRFGGSEKS